VAAALGRLLDMNEMEQLMQQIDTTYDISFSRRQGDYRFCTTGVRHVTFWDKEGKKRAGNAGRGSDRVSHAVNCWDE